MHYLRVSIIYCTRLYIFAAHPLVADLIENQLPTIFCTGRFCHWNSSTSVRTPNDQTNNPHPICYGQFYIFRNYPKRLTFSITAQLECNIVRTTRHARSHAENCIQSADHDRKILKQPVQNHRHMTAGNAGLFARLMIVEMCKERDLECDRVMRMPICVQVTHIVHKPRACAHARWE